MKIYSVTAGHNRTLWTNYQSAAQSYAYWHRRDPSAVLEAVHVPDDAWKPVDRRTEARLSQVQFLWEQLVASDPDGLDHLLDELVKKVSPPTKEIKPLASGGIVMGSLLREEEREEAMLRLNRLVDA